jgi:hypothetical protein
LLRGQSPRAEWHAALLSWAEQQITEHRAAAPLMLDDPQWNADLLTAFAAVAQLQTPTEGKEVGVLCQI